MEYFDISIEGLTIVYSKYKSGETIYEKTKIISHYPECHPQTNSSKDIDRLIMFFKQLELKRQENI